MQTKKWAIKSLFILVVFLLLTGSVISYLDWRNNYSGRIYPGIEIGSLDLSGKTPPEALDLLNKKTTAITTQGLSFQYENKKITLDSAVSSFDSDLSYPSLVFDVEGTIKQAVAASQPQTFLAYLLFKLSPSKQKVIKPLYSLDEQKIKNSLAENYKELNIPPTNSSFSISSKTGQLETSSEKIGKEINYDLVFEEIKNNLNLLNNFPVIIKTHSKYPEVKALDLASLEAEAKKIINSEDLKLIFNDLGGASTTIKTWTLKPERILTWLSVKKEQEKLQLSLDQEKIKQYLLINVSPEIDLEAIRPRFEINNGKVASWQTGASGRQLDLEASANKLTTDFLNGKKEIELIVKEITENSLSADKNFNIKELIGTGHSNFSGSPANRRKNIKIGAEAVHGILLAPGEEFSLVKVLGDVSEKTGYLPELVIKGNKTVPEYGGGLCQIGTTVFRAALASGLPITARRNHSYRVSYYEPAGTDAAVYIPQPDVAFLNDTANYVLIQARIIKNDIYFDFWGTKDGRVATTTKPTIYNIVKPEPTKYVETADLPAGEKKCTEKAHNGADAYFDYKVIYPEGATTTPIQERRFSSHYVPWQEVCLIGKGAATSTATTTIDVQVNASSTTSTSTKI